MPYIYHNGKPILSYVDGVTVLTRGIFEGCKTPEDYDAVIEHWFPKAKRLPFWKLRNAEEDLAFARDQEEFAQDPRHNARQGFTATPCG